MIDFEEAPPLGEVLDDLNGITHTPSNKNAWRRRGRRTAIGSIAVTGLVAVSHINFFQKSGESRYYRAINDAQKEQVIDGEFRMGSWNMHGEAGIRAKQIGRIGKKYKLDVIALQEVNADDAETLHEKNPGWHIEEVLAEPIQHGGYADILMTKDTPKDISTTSFEGTSLGESIEGVAFGAAKDFSDLNTSIKNTKDGWQEKRAAVALTIRTRFNGILKDVRVITSHIASAGNPGKRGTPREKIHKNQLKKLLKFIGENKKSGRPTIFAGDLNDYPENVEPAFTDIGMYVPRNPQPTSVNRDLVLDYFAYNEAGILGDGNKEVMPEETDHHLTVIGFDGNQMHETIPEYNLVRK